MFCASQINATTLDHALANIYTTSQGKLENPGEKRERERDYSPQGIRNFGVRYWKNYPSHACSIL